MLLEQYWQEMTGAEAAPELVVDFDAEQTTCPACLTTFRPEVARCPGCGLRFG